MKKVATAVDLAIDSVFMTAGLFGAATALGCAFTLFIRWSARLAK